jgi:uncharacterized coiled-coil protein SlyX
MNNLSFSEKNAFIVRHKSGKYFFQDLELFKRHFQNHRLNNELARANSFTYERLDGLILFELLNKVSPEEILLNRSKETEKTPVKPVIENTDQAKEELLKMGIDPEKISPEFLQTNIGMSRKSFTDLFHALKKAGDRNGLVGLEIHTLQADPRPDQLIPADPPTDPIDETHSPNTTETIDPNVDSLVTDEKINHLEDRIDALEENLNVDESELSDLREELSNNQISVDELSEKIEALEKKAFNKKKTGKKNSRK